jgi:hypothetical protein
VQGRDGAGAVGVGLDQREATSLEVIVSVTVIAAYDANANISRSKFGCLVAPIARA